MSMSLKKRNKLEKSLIKKPPKKPTSIDVKEFNKLIIKEETGMNRELFLKCFNFQMPTAMLKAVYNTNSKKKNNDLINVIKSGLSDLKNEIKKVSQEDIKFKKPYEIVDTVEKILEFNRQNQEGHANTRSNA